MRGEDVLERLAIDPGKRTIGELIQDREAAVQEIMRLRIELQRRPATAARSTPAETTLLRPTDTLLALRDVCALLRISRSSVYKRLLQNSFPQPIRLGPRTVRWRLDCVRAWRDASPPQCTESAQAPEGIRGVMRR